MRLAKKFRIGAQRAEIAFVSQSFNGPYHDFVWDQTNPHQRNDFDRRNLLTLKTEF
jgi:hypothetical protein